jgi:coenzyme F420-reducing hydrogenase delta subunit
MADLSTAPAPSDARHQDFEPRIVAFVCKWCTYAGADLAGTIRLKYPHNVRLIKLPCTGRADCFLIVKAFEQGADAVLVSGCHPGDCHYRSGNYSARRRFQVFRELLGFMGVDLRRVHFAWVSAAEGAKWAETVAEISDQVRQLGPYTEFRELRSGPRTIPVSAAPSSRLRGSG